MCIRDRDAIDLWDKEPDMILEELDEASNQPKTPFPFVRTPTVLTPTAPPATPTTPINHMGNKNGPKQNAKNSNNQNGNNNNKNKNKNNNKEPTWAEISKLNIPTEVMETKDPREYAQKVAALNKIIPNHIPEERNPEAVRKPKIAADMEKIASVIGIKNINWSETRTHAVGHEKNKGEATREILAKSSTYAEARVRYAILYINSRMGIPINKLPITEAWSASNVESKIMWVRLTEKLFL